MEQPKMSSEDDQDVDFASSTLFQEPADYFAPEKPATFCEHKMLDGKILKLRLIGTSPLWGHLLWNASRVMARYIEEHACDMVQEKSILEFGAGAGLPGIVCALKGAQIVVVTDYPDQDLVENLKINIKQCVDSDLRNICVEGYVWGAPPTALLAHLESHDGARFDLLILADLLFNHSEHAKLVLSVQSTLKRNADARALVFFTPHRPWLFDKDMAFFDLVKEGGLSVDKILEEKMEKAMVADGSLRVSIHDGGDEPERKIVYGYELRWASLS